MRFFLTPKLTFLSWKRVVYSYHITFWALFPPTTAASQGRGKPSLPTLFGQELVILLPVGQSLKESQTNSLNTNKKLSWMELRKAFLKFFM